MDLKKEFERFGVDTFGVCPATEYNMSEGTDYKSCIVALFPYFCGYKSPSNMSIYTHGEDYHLVTRRILEAVASGMRLEDYRIHSDTGPSIERKLALEAGLAFPGKNGLCINPRHGSYFFIGYIVCNEDLPVSQPLNTTCMGCELCISSCPTGAIGNGFSSHRCLSAITQKRGELEPWETEAVRNNGTIFGCDICQRVCPHNKDIPYTGIPEFKENLIPRLSAEDIDNLSDRAFRRKYANRAFAWRGVAPLKRNLHLTKEENNENSNT